MTKTTRQAQARRAKRVKRRLQTILEKIVAVIAPFEASVERAGFTNDAHNLLGCLLTAKERVMTARDNYCTFL